jgi:hypothetical protein
MEPAHAHAYHNLSRIRGLRDVPFTEEDIIYLRAGWGSDILLSALQRSFARSVGFVLRYAQERSERRFRKPDKRMLNVSDSACVSAGAKMRIVPVEK